MRIALTSARETSKRLYRKELRKLGNKYIIEWTLEQMMACKLFDIRLMSTDWEELIEMMEWKYPEIIFIKRPKNLALVDTPAQAYITHALLPYKEEGNEYCLLQSTSPLRSMELVYDTYTQFHRDYNSLFTVNRYTLYPDGQVYWFRDPTDIWKAPSFPYFCDPSGNLDYPHDLRIAEFLLRKKGGIK